MRIWLLVLAILNVGCFWGNENYEKSVNDYYFLYELDNSNKRKCLGTIEYDQARIGSMYLCDIEKIGWDDKFIIVKNSRNEYFIQECRNLNMDSVEKYKLFLNGPMPLKEFEVLRSELEINFSFNHKF